MRYVGWLDWELGVIGSHLKHNIFETFSLTMRVNYQTVKKNKNHKIVSKKQSQSGSKNTSINLEIE